MRGDLPLLLFHVRHVRGLRMNNVHVTTRQKNELPAFLLDDVFDSDFNGIKVENDSPFPAFSVNSGCKGIRLDGRYK